MKRDVTIIAYVTAIAGVAAALTVPWLLAVILPVAGLVMYLAYRQEPRSPRLCVACKTLPAEVNGGKYCGVCATDL